MYHSVHENFPENVFFDIYSIPLDIFSANGKMLNGGRRIEMSHCFTSGSALKHLL